jgi:hypothetical protein
MNSETSGWGADLATVIAGLDPAIHPLDEALSYSMDAWVISAFTRVFDALLPAHDESSRSHS